MKLNNNSFAFTAVMTASLTSGAFAAELDVLVFSANTQPWAHTHAVNDGIAAINQMGQEENWNVTHSVNSSLFTTASLAQFDVIVFNNTSGDNLFNQSQQAAFQAYIRSGGGYVGIHTASATEFDWEWYGELVGAVNNVRDGGSGHPRAQSATLNVENDTHPSTLNLSNSFSEHGEWFYWAQGTDPRQKDGMKILLSLDGDSLTDTSGGSIDDSKHPVAWCREFEGGRSFYTVQGHFGAVYNQSYFRTFLAEGIKWAADAVEQNGLLLDLDANKSVTVENGNKVTRWLNQAPTNAAQVFQSTDHGREVTNAPLANRGVDLLGPGSGRPTLLSNIADLNGNNSISFREEDLVNLEENAFDHLNHGTGYTWLAVLSRDNQRWPSEDIREVNAFFGNLRNGNPFDGIWGGFDSQNRIWASTRTLNASGRDATGDDWIIGPAMPEKEYFIAAGRLGAGQGTQAMELFINNADAIASVPVSINPNGNPSFMAIGTERFAVNHPGRESFDGEMARFLIYERPLSDLELQQTIANLQDKYFADSATVGAPVSNAFNFNFESGDLQGATITGSLNPLTNLANFHLTRTPYNKEGNYFISTLEHPNGASDAHTGTVTSPSFILNGGEVSFLIGGGMSPELSFSIHNTIGQTLYSGNRGVNAEPLERRSIDLSAFIGQEVFWRITDNSRNTWGYIAIDDIRFDGIPVDSNNFESGSLAGLVVRGNLPAPLQSRDNFLVPSLYSSPLINKEGNYFISTIDGANGSASDRFTGEITSEVFTLTSSNVSLLVAGGSNSDLVSFGVYDDFGLELVTVASRTNTEQFERVDIDLSPHVGKQVFWQIRDYSTGSWGFITVDDIQFNDDTAFMLNSQDIGAVGAAGSYSGNSGGHVIEASGKDIWNTSDDFHFASTNLAGNGEIIALVDNVVNTHRWAKGGIMMRNSYAANAQNIFVFVAPDGRFTMQVRAVTNGRTFNITSNSAVGTGRVGVPKFVSLRREGNSFIGSYSEDGSNFTEINRVTVHMGDNILTGLAATSHSNGRLTTAQFSSVIIHE